MRADELRSAVEKIVIVLAKADLLNVVRNYRAAKGGDRTVAAARLGHAGAVVMENMEKFSPSEQAVVRTLHLDSLGSTAYWQSLLESVNEPKKQAAELVSLYSRVMFASDHLPKFAKMLALDSDQDGYQVLLSGQRRITIRLSDAGEKASDPDRVARAIDGIDMLYSACASISKKPAMDLRLDGVTGSEHRDASFTGDAEGISAVIAVLESIPDALSEFDDSEDFQVSDIVAALPIFHDLKTLGSLGTFTDTDLHDISETMEQGVVLILESGVLLLDEQAPESSPVDSIRSNAPSVSASVPAQAAAAIASGHIPTQGASSSGNSVIAETGPASSTDIPNADSSGVASADSPELPDSGEVNDPPVLTKRGGQASSEVAYESSTANGAVNGSGAERDEHYERYLREREAMQRGSSASGADEQLGSERRDAVAELLKTLDRDRNGK